MVYVRGFYLNAILIIFQIPRAAKGSRSCNWKPQYPHIKANTSLSSLPKLDLPPSPALFASSFPPFTPYVKISRSIQRTSRLGLFEDIWGLRTDRDAQPPDPGLLSVNEHTAPSSGFDVLHALKTTTHAIRSVLNYLLFFPNEHGHTQPRQGFPSVSLSTSEPQKRRVSSGKDHTDPLVRVRHPALDVLALLRELEESGRLPLSDDASDVGSDCSSQSRVELSHNGQSVVRLLRPTMRSCAHTLLVTFLLASLLPHVSSSPDRAEFLNAVSSGQLLYLAYDDVFDSPGSPGNTSTRTRYCRSR